MKQRIESPRAPARPQTGLRQRIALAFPLSIAFVERVSRGIFDYARKRGRWTFTRMPERLSLSIDWLRHWPGDGAITMITTPEDVKLARSLPFPVVSLVGYVRQSKVPTVMPDQEAIGRLGAEHLLERRFQRFGFYGTRGVSYSELRRAGFQSAVQRAGGHCSVLEVPETPVVRRKWTDQQDILQRWLKTLHPPVGVMACSDLRACMVLDAAEGAGLRVPEDLALIGVDNDPLVCEFCQPTLTSVSRNDWQLGHQSAALLDRLMDGGSAPKQPWLIAPDRVVPRRSTQTLAVDDPQLATIVQHIRAHLHEPFGVERILEHSALSRRQLEYRFQQNLGCSPYALINTLRVERARQLLAEPARKTFVQIAAACGFHDARRFRIVFQRITGLTPAEHRQRSLVSPARLS